MSLSQKYNTSKKIISRLQYKDFDLPAAEYLSASNPVISEYLKNFFKKTETNSQRELVGFSSPSPLSNLRRSNTSPKSLARTDFDDSPYKNLITILVALKDERLLQETEWAENRFESIIKTIDVILDKSGNNFMEGPDYRELHKDKCLLTNACLLFHLYPLEKYKRKLHQDYWNGSFFDDFPGAISFDVLGNALTILYEIASKTQMESIIKFFMNTLLSTSREYTWQDGFMLMAMLKSGKRNLIEFVVEGCEKFPVENVNQAVLFVRIMDELQK